MIIDITPLSKRSTYAGIGAATEAVAALTAPLFGGLLTDSLGWRWCFYVQLPVIAATFIVTFLSLDSVRLTRIGPALHQLDFLGTAMLLAAITSLLLGLQWGGAAYEWSDWRPILLLCLFSILLAVFMWHQSRLGDRATLPSRILRRRTLLFGFFFSFCNNASLSVLEYYVSPHPFSWALAMLTHDRMPIYFQTVKGYSARMSGVMVLPTAAGLVAAVPLAGYLTSLLGYYGPFMLINSLMTPPAAGLLSTLSPDSEVWRFVLYQALLGFGAGIGFQGPQVAAQAIFSDSDAQIGIATIQLAQALGPAGALAGAQSIFTSSLSLRVARLGLAVDLGDQGLAIPEGLSTPKRLAVVSSYSKALSDAFYLPVALACLTTIGVLGIEWRSVKDRSSRSQS